MSNFLDQYNANCREYTRRTPIRLLKLAVAFVTAMVLGSLCYLVVDVTGQRAAALVVLVPGVIVVFVAWCLFLRWYDRPRVETQSYSAPLANSPLPAPSGDSPWAPHGFPASPQSVVPAQAVGSPQAWKQVQPAPSFAQPELAFPSPPRTKSGSGLTIALLAIFGVMALSCCGGGVALLGFVAHVSDQVATPEAQFNGPVGIRIDDTFADMQRRQQKQLDDMMRRQDEHARDMERNLERMHRGSSW